MAGAGKLRYCLEMHQGWVLLCWRSDTPLIYRAVPSRFVRVRREAAAVFAVCVLTLRRRVSDVQTLKALKKIVASMYTQVGCMSRQVTWLGCVYTVYTSLLLV
jgi:isoleucyl-tRNA synthetase